MNRVPVRRPYHLNAIDGYALYRSDLNTTTLDWGQANLQAAWNNKNTGNVMWNGRYHWQRNLHLQLLRLQRCGRRHAHGGGAGRAEESNGDRYRPGSCRHSPKNAHAHGQAFASERLTLPGKTAEEKQPADFEHPLDLAREKLWIAE